MATQISLTTDQTGANTAIDISNPVVFNFSVTLTYLLYEGRFSMKKGSSSTDGVTATLYNAANGGGTALTSVFIAAASFFQTYTDMSFLFSDYNLPEGTYSLKLTTTSASGGNSSYFIKAGSFQVRNTSDNTVLSVGYAISSSPSAVTTITPLLKATYVTPVANLQSTSTLTANQTVFRKTSSSLVASTTITANATVVNYAKINTAETYANSNLTSQGNLVLFANTSLQSSANFTANTSTTHSAICNIQSSNAPNTIILGATLIVSAYSNINNSFTFNLNGNLNLNGNQFINISSELMPNANLIYFAKSLVEAISGFTAITNSTQNASSNLICNVNKIVVGKVNYIAVSSANCFNSLNANAITSSGVSCVLESSSVSEFNSEVLYFADTLFAVDSLLYANSSSGLNSQCFFASETTLNLESVLLQFAICQIKCESSVDANGTIVGEVECQIQINNNASFYGNVVYFAEMSMNVTGDVSAESFAFKSANCQLVSNCDAAIDAKVYKFGIFASLASGIQVNSVACVNYFGSSLLQAGSTNLGDSQSQISATSTIQSQTAINGNSLLVKFASLQIQNVVIVNSTARLIQRTHTGVVSASVVSGMPNVDFKSSALLISNCSLNSNYEVFVDVNYLCVGLRCLGIKAGECKTCQNGLAYMQLYEDAYLPAMTVCIQELTTKASQPKKKYVYKQFLPRKCRRRQLEPESLYY